ncbi:MAG TPA: heavy metal-binding domain-containing protein, partial [Bacteroidota bacterium]|nr:heavy metal-binding domain-containing protein [Bacteroidota bacterium]
MKTFAAFTLLVSLLIAWPGCSSKKAGNTSGETATGNEYYTCPMHPSVRSDKPGICPICHMTLVKVSQNQ